MLASTTPDPHYDRIVALIPVIGSTAGDLQQARSIVGRAWPPWLDLFRTFHLLGCAPWHEQTMSEDRVSVHTPDSASTEASYDLKLTDDEIIPTELRTNLLVNPVVVVVLYCENKQV